MTETPEEYEARRDRIDCTRIAKSRGRRCGQRRVPWLGPAETPDPQSCEWHLTDAERAARERYRAENAARFGFWPLQKPDGTYIVASRTDADPACWSWPAPETCTFADEQATEDFLQWWNHRCAICDHGGELVCDHDHATGLVRGYLCVSCNAREGHAGNDGVFGKYRQRNPATILGLRLRYWDPFHGYAEPEPPPSPLDQSAAYVLASMFEPVTGDE